MVRITFRNGKFLGKCQYEERIHFQNARWDYHRKYKVWFTTSPMRAGILRKFMDTTAKIQLGKSVILRDLWDDRPSQILVPKGLSLLEHQPIAITYALKQNKSYLGLDPGLGKTIVAAIIAHNLGQRVIYTCPPFLVANTYEEFIKWAPSLRTVVLNDVNDPKWFDVLIIPDSMIHKEDVRQLIKRHCSFGPTTLFIDEAHRFKNDEARRTKTLLGERRSRKRGRKVGIIEFENIERIVPMSGTPMPNRPMELYGILDRLAPECIDFMNKFEYGNKYCAGFKDDYGWDFSGASNMKELQKRVIGPFMLRMKKAQWMKSLPPKIEEIIILDGKSTKKLEKISSSILAKHSPEDLIKRQIAKAQGTSEEELHIATYRRLLGLEKVKKVVEYIKNILEDSEEKLILFGVHKDVIYEVEKALSDYQPLVITGDTKMDVRHEHVKEFQRNERKRIIMGNIDAMGVGFTLTKAHRVIFFEWAWVPGVNDQGGDRAHRIGLEHGILVQFLVLANSLDRPVIETLLKKRSATQYI